MSTKLGFVLAFYLTLNFAAYSQWIPLNNGQTDMGYLASSGTTIFASVSNGIVFSTNNGESWSYTTSGLPSNIGGNALSSINSRVLTSTPYGVYATTNGGLNWVNSNNGIGNIGITAFAVSGTKIFAGSYIGYDTGYVFVSTDNGINWTSLGRTNFGILDLTVSESNIYACSPGKGVMFSSNNGQNWSRVNTGLTNLNVWRLTSIGSVVFAGTPDYPVGGVYRTTNNGVNWETANTGLDNRDIRSFAVYGNFVFAGTAGGVFMSTDYGLNWLNRNQGFTTLPTVYCMLNSNNYIYAGIFQNRTYRRLLNNILDVNENSSIVASNYTLFQNYPNPFNPSTKIKFDVAKTGVTKISVYDITGREIKILVNEILRAGTYEAVFSGRELSSGIYFIRMTTGTFTEVRKAVLLK